MKFKRFIFDHTEFIDSAIGCFPLFFSPLSRERSPVDDKPSEK